MATIARSSKTETAGVSVLDQLARIEASGLSAATAHSILEIQFDASQQSRVSELAARASAGTLTIGERAEYEEWIAAADRLAILQSKARLALARTSQAT